MNMIKRTRVGSSFSIPKTSKAEPRDRAAGLAGLLPPRTSAPAAPVQAPEPSIEVVQEQSAAPDTHKSTKVRAVTQNRAIAGAVGIDTNRVDAMTFALGSGLAGIAGCLFTMIGSTNPGTGQLYIV